MYQSISEKLQSDEPCKRDCGPQASCERLKNGEESCVCRKNFRGNSEGVCEFKCEAHTDCPSEMSCYVDRRCRNPCIHSLVRCGRDAKCKVEKHRPVCYCPPDFVGDAKKQCFNTLQGKRKTIYNSNVEKIKTSSNSIHMMRAVLTAV